jgi:hypothetical protein
MIFPGVDLFRALPNTLWKFMIIANSWQGVLKSEHTTAACEVGYVTIQPCSIPGNCVLCFRTNKVLLQWKGNLDETLLQKCASKNSVLPELFSCSASDFFLSLERLHGTTIREIRVSDETLPWVQPAGINVFSHQNGTNYGIWVPSFCDQCFAHWSCPKLHHLQTAHKRA